MLVSPHFCPSHLVVVQWTSAVRSLHALLLVGVVHLRSVDVVVVIWIWVRVIVLLIAWQTIVWRLPTRHGVGDVRAVVAAIGLVTAVCIWL